MSKFTCFVLCVMIVSINRAFASEEKKAAFRQVTIPIILKCSEEHGVSIDELRSAKAAGSVEGINPCFLGCAYKKAGVFNSKGEFDLDAALIKLEEFMGNGEEFAKLAEIGKKCVSVNEKPVTDGEAGCERGLLLTTCFFEERAEIPI